MCNTCNCYIVIIARLCSLIQTELVTLKTSKLYPQVNWMSSNKVVIMTRIQINCHLVKNCHLILCNACSCWGTIGCCGFMHVYFSFYYISHDLPWLLELTWNFCSDSDLSFRSNQIRSVFPVRYITEHLSWNKHHYFNTFCYILFLFNIRGRLRFVFFFFMWTNFLASQLKRWALQLQCN